MKRIIATLLALLFAPALHAQYSVDPDGSHLGFASVKNEVIGENHSFTSVVGGVSADGAFVIVIDLASVETLIPIRNERMREMLFDVANFPSAIVSGDLDLATFEALKVGESRTATIDMNIALHGVSLRKSALTKTTRIANDAFEVTSLGPVLVNAADFKLSEGVEALREIAGLIGIEPMVPVTFNLKLVR